MWDPECQTEVLEAGLCRIHCGVFRTQHSVQHVVRVQQTFVEKTSDVAPYTKWSPDFSQRKMIEGSSGMMRAQVLRVRGTDLGECLRGACSLVGERTCSCMKDSKAMYVSNCRFVEVF